MSVEEIKEFMEEQRKRFSDLGSDDDYDDYYDNDAEIDYGDDPNDEEDAAPVSRVHHQVLSSPTHQIQVRFHSVSRTTRIVSFLIFVCRK